MAKSESEIKKMTKFQLQQWLLRHDQSLPQIDQKKKYYSDRAMKYFQLLQKQKKNSSSRINTTNQSQHSIQRSRSKKKKPIMSNSRTKKKTQSQSITPRKNRNKSPALNRSKKKVIHIQRKTPKKQSPSIVRVLTKKRAKMRRATADPHNLSQMQAENDANSSENESDDDDGERASENGGDYSNGNMTKIFYLDTDPEKMTISRLQHWLDNNNINFLQGCKKQIYVNLVKRYSSKKRDLSPQHKKTYSPQPKKCKANSVRSANRGRKRHQSYAGAPLPSNLHKAPFTPQDDEKSRVRPRLKRKSISNDREHLLSTPALNKNGISRIDTPSKLQMRDEIRNLLAFDPEGDTQVLYPVPSDGAHPQSNDVTDGVTPGITPGGPSNYDPGVLGNVLSDLRRHKKETQPPQALKTRRKSMDPTNVYNPRDKCDAKQDGKPSESFIGSMFARFSPHRRASSHSMQSEVANALMSTAKRKHKNSYVAKRTLPSPVTPQDFNLNDDKKAGDLTPMNNYQQKLQLNEGHTGTYYEDEPMSPAIEITQRSPIDQKKIENNVRRSMKKNKKPQSQSPAIMPSIPSLDAMKNNQKLSPHKLPFEKKETKVRNRGRCKAVVRILFLALFGAAIASFFAVFDGMEVINEQMNLLSDFVDNYGAEEVLFFCDTGKVRIGEGEGGDCRRCPAEASFCSNGQALCKPNYILEDDKCVLDGVVVKIAYDLKKQIHKILAEKRGKYQCDELEESEGYGMSGDELMANLVVFDDSKKGEAFAYFKEHILPDSSIISMKGKGEYFSHKSSKSAPCKMKQWALSNILGIISGFIVMVLVFSMWCKYKRGKWEKKEIDAMVGKIYNLLEEFERFNKQRYVPIDVIKQRIKPKSNKLWKSVDALVQKDINIQKSIRMIDGMQKRCLALSSIQSGANNHNNNPYDNNTQQQWNQYDDQRRFPTHSKRPMF